MITQSLLVGLIALFAFLAYRSRRSRPPVSTEALPSFLIPAYTNHARLLPIPSRHAFSYPLLYIGADIDSIEDGALDLPGRLLAYGGRPISKILGLRSDGYFEPGREPLRTKLEALLDAHDVNISGELSRVWLVTMPSFVGVEGINPLSVWYCYRKPQGECRGELLCVVLEVHNTFGEKHAYVLKMTSEYRHDPKPGYDIAWTFPRSFHVSPFNSRNGYYRLDIADPFSTSLTQPNLMVFLRLLTPARKIKLQALLASKPLIPSILIDPQNSIAIARTIIQYPLALLLTTPRILYQAYWLHYEKKLLVYPRPEPRFKGDETDWNPSELDETGVGIGVGWQNQSWAERKASTIIRIWAEKRAKVTGIDFTMLSVVGQLQTRIETKSGGGKLKLEIISNADPKAFTNLLSIPTSTQYIALAPELRTTISSPELFEEFFARSLDTISIIDRITESIRDWHIRWYWTRSDIAPTPDLVSYVDGTIWINTGLLGLVIVFLSYFADVAEESISSTIGAMFVQGREPWKLWERALARQYVAAGVYGPTGLNAKVDNRKKTLITSMADREEADDWVDLGSLRYDP